MTKRLATMLSLSHKERYDAEQIETILSVLGKEGIEIEPYENGYGLTYPDGSGEFMYIRGVLKTVRKLNEQMFSGPRREANGKAIEKAFLKSKRELRPYDLYPS